MRPSRNDTNPGASSLLGGLHNREEERGPGGVGRDIGDRDARRWYGLQGGETFIIVSKTAEAQTYK
jgi:hypothetical protein